MDFAGAIKDGFVRYARFDGVTSRSGFWYWKLFAFLAAQVAGVIPPLSLVAALALTIPDLAMSIRRSRDSGFSAWFQLLWLVPVVALWWKFSEIVALINSTSIDWELVDESNAKLVSFAEAILPLIAPTVLTYLGVWLFFIITWILPTKTSAQGNRLVKQ